MASTQPRQFRLSDEELADIDEIGREWGPVKPLSRTDVIREMTRREKRRIQQAKARKEKGK